MITAAPLPIFVEPEGEFWFPVQTRFRFEKKVAAELTGKGLHVFLPLRRETRSWGDRTKEISVPLFPGYLFVHSSRSVLTRIAVLQTGGVMGFVSMAGTAATIPQMQMENLRLLLAEEVPLSMHPFTKAGRRVRIRGGRLDGVEGFYKQNGREKLLISIDSIQRSVAIDIPNYEVEVLE
jgi:transcription termination/antitermination protein NusG